MNKSHRAAAALPRLWFAGLCFMLAAFFKFALIGYSFTALILSGVGCTAAAYWLLRLLAETRPRAARTWRRVLTACLALFVLGFACFEIPIVRAAKTDADPQADYLIVLGAGVNGTTPSLSMVNRLTAALDYLGKYPDSKVIVSGGRGPGEDITEAEAMRVWLTDRGIAPGRIIEEGASTSTLENLTNSLDIIEALGGDRHGRVAVCSSEYHLYRAKLMAGSLGAQPLGVAGRTTYPVLRLNYFAREAFAVAYMLVFG